MIKQVDLRYPQTQVFKPEVRVYGLPMPPLGVDAVGNCNRCGRRTQSTGGCASCIQERMNEYNEGVVWQRQEGT